ncbi:gap junction alpha-9 protein [Pangasianodon hypophthalmus]|uniref:gap junction alpha-9 protein n=1 Tax=Pangasianodon hypophthalmus TaxID=310915 RepID=UPI002307D130|nr:gap junction alpha-9 protein [Pangasianodon hypophthalmus]
MGDWNFLGGILEEVHIHSTMVGKIWLTVLFIFRMLVLGVAAEDVWNDEQLDFICNTQQPGCRNVCYDCAFPVSLIRYWVLQVIFVSSPSLVYMGHAIYRLRALEKQRHCRKAALRRELEALESDLLEARRRVERELRQLEQGKLNKAPLRGSLLRTYIAHIVTRSSVEFGFLLGQHLLYGNHLEPLYRCDHEPCPNSVDCFVSRPTEKSMFMVFMQVIAAVSLFLSLLEIVHLGYKKVKRGILDYYTHVQDDLEDCCGSKFKKNFAKQPVCVSQGRKATIPTAPTGGYVLLLEKKQANGASLPPLTGSSSTFLQSGAKRCLKGQNEGKYSVPTEHTSSCTHSPHEFKQLETENSTYPTLPITDSTSCPTSCPSGAAWKLQCISSTVMEGNVESCNCSTGRQIYDFTAKPNECTSKSESVCDVSSDSRRSPALSPNRRKSLVSTVSSRRATDLQI